MQVTENGSIVGEYTFHLSGMQVSDVECGVLSSEVHLPLGIVKPYRIIEKSVLERALNDEQDFINEPFTTIRNTCQILLLSFSDNGAVSILRASLRYGTPQGVPFLIGLLRGSCFFFGSKLTCSSIGEAISNPLHQL